MGKSIRSKRKRANRNRKRQVNRPKELSKLKQALAFEYNDETENAHLSMFSDVVNGPLPDDYFEPSKTILEKRQEKYENFLSRKIPKIAEIASKNLVKPIGSPERKKTQDDNEMSDSTKSVPKVNTAMDCSDGCKPSKSGSWPVWMNQRKIKAVARVRRKIIKRTVKRDRRMNKSKYIEEKKKKRSSKQNSEKMET